jgi:hypothetical protein
MLTNADIQSLSHVMELVLRFGFVDGIFYTLGALKLADLLFIVCDRIHYRVKRYLERVA